jgi:hypothetical protein
MIVKDLAQRWPQSRSRWFKLALLSILLLIAAGIGYQIDIALPSAPALRQTVVSKATAQELGSYDILGHVVSRADAEQLLQTEAGRQQLSAESGAIAITPKLIHLGRQAFYSETFGNEFFFTDVVGTLEGPINIGSMTKAIARLRGQHTSNLQIPLEQDLTVGGRAFPAGTLINTGMDVPAGSFIPLGIKTHLHQGKVRVGITCALCHATIDSQTGRIREGAPNIDINPGLIMAFASNSAAMFRHTDVNPTRFAAGDRTYKTAEDQQTQLPNAQAVEDAVDAALLRWPPGNFDSTGTLVNNPAQIPSSYTFAAHPYGWSGHAAIGWFQGLTTLNSNVHATNSDTTTGADGSLATLGIDKEQYLGVILQNAANPAFRLPEGVQPSQFFNAIDPTPGEPAINQVIRMPGYPKGSPFMLDGLMASAPGLPVGQQLNAMSAWQNTLAPPPSAANSPMVLQRGARIFTQAGCAECHHGRYFTNHRVIAQTQLETQPSRANTLAPIGRSFTMPQTYPNQQWVPVSANASILDVPTDITAQADQQLAFALNDPAGGYKVPSLIGLAVTAPYLHDGGVAATAEALQVDRSGEPKVAHPDQLGMAGTLMQNRLPDPGASLQVLLDRELRQQAIAANRSHPDLQQVQVDGSGHHYWVDRQAGFTPQEQTDLIQFLLSLDDDPAVLPETAAVQ